MFLLCSPRAPARSNWNVHAHTEFLPCSWNFSIFIINILIMHITRKKILKCPAVVRSCKNFLLRTVAGPRSCKKNIRGNVVRKHPVTRRSFCYADILYGRPMHKHDVTTRKGSRPAAVEHTPHINTSYSGLVVVRVTQHPSTSSLLTQSEFTKTLPPLLFSSAGLSWTPELLNRQLTH
jgi:hypothetical protein